MKWSQLKYLTAIVLIGDGILATLRPNRDAHAWNIGPQAWKNLMQYLSDHPEMLRAIGVAEVTFGFALIASRGTAAEELAKVEAGVRVNLTSIA